MQRNNDPQQIVMSIEMYNSLIATANDSTRYTTAHIRYHVRKMNPHLQAAHQKAVREQESIRSRRIREARAFFEANHGKTIYATVDMGRSKKDDVPVLFPCVSVRIDRVRRFIRIRHVDDINKRDRSHVVTADSLRLEIPEGYVPGIRQVLDLPRKRRRSLRPTEGRGTTSTGFERIY